MRDEYAGREVALDAIQPLLSSLQISPQLSSALARFGPEVTRISWDQMCEILEIAAQDVADPRTIGSRGVASAATKFAGRLRFARRLLTLEDALRFIVFPRHPIDFACVNTAVNSEPGRVDVVAYILERFAPSPIFFQIMQGAAEEFMRLGGWPNGRVTLNVQGRQAHFVFSYTPSNSVPARVHRFVSRQFYAAYILAVIRSSYTPLVEGRKLFEEQLVERAKVEEALTASQQAFERRTQHVDDVIVEFDERGDLIYISSNIKRLLGIAPHETTEYLQHVVHAEDLDRVREQFRAGLAGSETLRIDDFRFLDAHGCARWAEMTLTPLITPQGERHTICTARDVSERRKLFDERQQLERHLEQTQRLEMLGVLAGGIAHDFNNLLMPIIGQTDLLSLQLDDSPDAQARLATIRTAAETAADLVKKLMAYAGTKPASFATLDLARETDELLQVLQTSILPNVELHVHLDDASNVWGDVTQLRQVVMNIVVNAAEAIGENPGRIDLSVRRTDTQIVLTVEDSGCGMDERTRARVFEPFYTTKFTGRGLGLSAVLGIVRAHHGEINLHSEPNRGSRVEITLPAADSKVMNKQDSKDSERQLSGTVLLADDEQDVREVGRQMLETIGYRVELAADGIEALAKVAEGRFDAVILDLVMPKLGGREVMHTLREDFPSMPVILISGYGPQFKPMDHGAASYTQFLSKPFSLQALRSTLSQFSAPSTTQTLQQTNHAERSTAVSTKAHESLQ